MATAAARNTLSLPAESVPFVGVAAIVTVTTLDLYDTCATVRDMNTIRAALNLPVLEDAAADTCAWIEKLDDNLPIGTSDIPEEVMRDRAHGSEADPLLPSSGDG